MKNESRISQMRRLLAVVLAAAMVFTGAAIPQISWAVGEDSNTASNVHYIAVASDRHNTTDAIEKAMSGMTELVEYVCLNGDMSSASGGGGGSRPSAAADPSGGMPSGAVPPEGGFPSGGEMPQPPSGSGSGSGGSGGSGSGGGSRPAMKQMPYNTSTVLHEVRGVFPKLGSDGVGIIFASHDASATDDAGIMKCANTSLLPSETQADYDEISAGQSGLIYTGHDKDGQIAYYIYGVSMYDMTNTGKIVGSDGYGLGAKTSAEAFKTFAASAEAGVPIIVIGHVPIHASRNDNLGASFWHEALNYAATGTGSGGTAGTGGSGSGGAIGSGGTIGTGGTINRAVVYVHGHNHTNEKDGTSGKAKEYLLEPESTMAIQGTERGQSTNETIYYTYTTGGYLRDNVDALLITVDGNSLSFEKYSGCTVSFDTQGGSSAKSATVKKGGKISAPSAVYRDGYSFTGWYKEANCVNEWDFSKDTVTKDMTLYAGWKEWNVESMSFTPASGTVPMSRIEVRDNGDNGVIRSLDLARRGSDPSDPSGSPTFFVKGDRCTVKYKDGTSKTFVYHESRSASLADFRADDGEVIQIEILATDLAKEIRNTAGAVASGNSGAVASGNSGALAGTSAGDPADLAAAVGLNGLTAEYRDTEAGKALDSSVLAAFTLTVTEDEAHDCAKALTAYSAGTPTCEKAAFSAAVYRCGVCNKYYSDAEAVREISRESVLLPALGHLWDSGTVTEANSRSAEGKKVYKCTREGCGASYEVSVGLRGHSFSEEWTADDASHWHACTEEGCSKRDSFGSHMWTSTRELISSPTCTSPGEAAYVCVICGAKQQGTSIMTAAEGHAFGAWTITEAATCTKSGSKERSCASCGYTVTAEIPASGHKYGGWTTEKEATELAEGVRTRSCTVCGDVQTGTIKKKTPTLKAAKINKPKAGKRSMTVKWTKLTGKNLKKASKIEIQYSTDRHFRKNVKTAMAKASATSKKIKKLKKGKTYYVRIRARNGKHISKWSSVKKAKVK